MTITDQLPSRATGWVASVVGPRARVVGVRALAGGTSSAVHAVDLEDAAGPARQLVLRRYVRPEVLEREPDAVAREAQVLDALVRTSVPAPRLVATDSTASSCDVPALLMTRLRGRPRTRPRDLVEVVARLAEPLIAIHAIPLPKDSRFPVYRQYSAPRVVTPPPWSTHRRAWEHAIERHATGPPAFTPTFIHRDYHPLNLLWSSGQVSGIVDWPSGCAGPAAVDIAHCRLNLVLGIGIEAADRFRDAALDQEPYDRAWDLLDAVDMLPDLDAKPAALARLDDFVARLVGATGLSPGRRPIRAPRAACSASRSDRACGSCAPSRTGSSSPPSPPSSRPDDRLTANATGDGDGDWDLGASPNAPPGKAAA